MVRVLVRVVVSDSIERVVMVRKLLVVWVVVDPIVVHRVRLVVKVKVEKSVVVVLSVLVDSTVT